MFLSTRCTHHIIPAAPVGRIPLQLGRARRSWRFFRSACHSSQTEIHSRWLTSLHSEQNLFNFMYIAEEWRLFLNFRFGTGTLKWGTQQFVPFWKKHRNGFHFLARLPSATWQCQDGKVLEVTCDFKAYFWGSDFLSTVLGTFIQHFHVGLHNRVH